jgi:hypothetical protein
VAKSHADFLALTMNGDRILVIVYGVCAVLLGLALIVGDLADMPYVWPAAVVVMVLIFAFPHVWERWRLWQGRRRAQKVWR